MGFNFKGLTSAALVTNNNHTAAEGNKDVAGIPASVERNTSVDIPRLNEKDIGGARDIHTPDSDEELNRIDTTAPKGVQEIQAITHVWTKKELIMAYIA
jgi:archaellum component FlaC